MTSGVARSQLSSPPSSIFFFLFPFMNNLYELWVEACRHEVWSCPWRERQLWQKTLMRWLFCSAGRQQANNSSINVCTLDPVTNGWRGWKSVLCVRVCKNVSYCVRFDRCGSLKADTYCIFLDLCCQSKILNQSNTSTVNVRVDIIIRVQWNEPLCRKLFCTNI